MAEMDKLTEVRMSFFQGRIEKARIIKHELEDYSNYAERKEYLERQKTELLKDHSGREILLKVYDPDISFSLKEIDYALSFVELELEHIEILKKLDRDAAVPKIERIKWKGSPALFGYIFSELVKNGFIDPPLFRGDPNYAGLAKLCFQYFNVNETTIENLIKEMNPKKNSLSDTKRAKFPNLSDLD
jgi:hypothetical protein